MAISLQTLHTNEVIERIRILDESVSGGRAFRALNEDLHGRDLSLVVDPHVAAITMVRASILRSAIGSVMASLDPADRRRNRASIGQLLDMLGDDDLAILYPTPGALRDAARIALEQAKRDYAAIIAGDAFQNGRRLRNEGVAHLLVSSAAIPNVEYEAIYGLQNEAERLVLALYQIIGLGQPQFAARTAELKRHAKVFWDTYFAGIGCRNHQLVR